jgi:PadR family transcriptional regulator PadR
MTKEEQEQIDILQGTLDMLILKTLLFGAQHGQKIAHSIENTSKDVIKVDHGSLYPALHRMERKGLISSEWGTSENNRRAKYYKLTKFGRQQLHAEASKWDRIVQAIASIMQPGKETKEEG